MNTNNSNELENTICDMKEEIELVTFAAPFEIIKTKNEIIKETFQNEESIKPYIIPFNKSNIMNKYIKNDAYINRIYINKSSIDNNFEDANILLSFSYIDHSRYLENKKNIISNDILIKREANNTLQQARKYNDTNEKNETKEETLPIINDIELMKQEYKNIFKGINLSEEKKTFLEKELKGHCSDNINLFIENIESEEWREKNTKHHYFAINKMDDDNYENDCVFLFEGMPTKEDIKCKVPFILNYGCLYDSQLTLKNAIISEIPESVIEEDIISEKINDISISSISPNKKNKYVLIDARSSIANLIIHNNIEHKLYDNTNNNINYDYPMISLEINDLQDVLDNIKKYHATTIPKMNIGDMEFNLLFMFDNTNQPNDDCGVKKTLKFTVTMEMVIFPMEDRVKGKLPLFHNNYL